MSSSPLIKLFLVLNREPYRGCPSAKENGSWGFVESMAFWNWSEPHHKGSDLVRFKILTRPPARPMFTVMNVEKEKTSSGHVRRGADSMEVRGAQLLPQPLDGTSHTKPRCDSWVCFLVRCVLWGVLPQLSISVASHLTHGRLF